MTISYKKLAFKFIKLVLIGYVVLVAGMYVMQRELQYNPDPARVLPSATKVPEMSVFDVTARDGTVNQAWIKMPDDPKQKIVVMFHGNASNQAGRADKARHFLDAGLGFVICGYRGYGGDPGTPTEDGLYDDARSLLQVLIRDRKIPEDQIVLYGESLGTGVAVKMAVEFPHVAGLILEVPFDSALSVAQGRYPYILGLQYLMKDQFLSDTRIGKLTMPKLFLLAGRDEVVPVAHGRRLFDLAPEPKRVIEFPQSQHSTTFDYGAGDKIRDFVYGLQVK